MQCLRGPQSVKVHQTKVLDMLVEGSIASDYWALGFYSFVHEHAYTKAVDRLGACKLAPLRLG